MTPCIFVSKGSGGSLMRRSLRRRWSRGRIVVTADLDFGAILARAGNATASVIVFRLANLQADRVCALLTKVLAQAANELKRGAVVLVEESRFRIRHLPPDH